MTTGRLVRDVMTIGVPVCRAAETCGVVRARPTGDAVVVLDEAGLACGWLTRARLEQARPDQQVREVMDEDIPTVPPDIPAQAAAQLMRDRGVEVLFLMHDWPGEPRPSAMITLRSAEARLAETA